MKKKFFKNWNWEKDFGEGLLSNDKPLPIAYAEVFYDYRGYVFRVIHKTAICRNQCISEEPEIITEIPPDEVEIDVSVYDYFYDANGRILEKRSLDDDGSVFLIVHFEYENEGTKSAEIGWYPNRENTPTKILF